MNVRFAAASVILATSLSGLSALPAHAQESPSPSLAENSSLSSDYNPNRDKGDLSFRYTPIDEDVYNDIFANRYAHEGDTEKGDTKTTTSPHQPEKRRTTVTTTTKSAKKKTVTVTVTPTSEPSNEELPPEWEGYVDDEVAGNTGVASGVDISNLDLGSEASEAAKNAVRYAYEQLGTPYVWGGTTMSTPGTGNGGLDCSGLTQGVYAKAGVSIPRVTYQQVNHGTSVPMDKILPGDLVFYNGTGHVAIYVGGGKVIHAPQTGDIVREASVSMMPVEKIMRVA